MHDPDESAEPTDDEEPFTRPPRKGKKRGPKPGSGQAKSPTRAETIARRRIVEQMSVDGFNLHEMIAALIEKTGQTWSRKTIYKDLDAIHAQWESEGHKRSRTNVRAALERKLNRIFRTAMEQKATATRRELVDGKIVVTTVLIPSPNLKEANRAVERTAAMHGLNVTTLDGSLGIGGGLADLFGRIAPELDKEEEEKP